jgi:hypothetical protein
MRPSPFSYSLPSFLLMLLLSACQGIQPDFGGAEAFFPSPTHLQKGIVNKYYYHLTPDEGDRQTNIEYRLFQMPAPNELIIKRYGPAMGLRTFSHYRFEEGKMRLMARKQYAQGDTIEAKLDSDVFLDWRGNEAPYEIQTLYEQGIRMRVVQRQLASGDSSLEGRPARYFRQQIRQYRIKDEAATDSLDLSIQTYYAQGLGLYGYEVEFRGGKGRLELVEQIPLAKFEQLADHQVKRIGYIDPRSRLDTDSAFALCGEERQIADYYNGQLDRAQLKGGKKALWAWVRPRLDSSLLFQESGYLTFRFVVNCEGETGWFTLEEADLAFQPTRFKTETIQHLLGILREAGPWQPVIIRDETRDAYTYVTFKLADGKLIELLP